MNTPITLSGGRVYAGRPITRGQLYTQYPKLRHSDRQIQFGFQEPYRDQAVDA